MTGSTRRQVTALILAGVFPGLGQLYNHQPFKGVVFFVVAAVLSWVGGREVPVDLLALAQAQPRAALVVPLLTLLGIWIWSIIDAWLVAGWRQDRR
jgi:hypothetical protein